MPIRMNPAHDTKTPPGTVVNFERPLAQEIDDWKKVSETHQKRLHAIFMEGYRVGYQAAQKNFYSHVDPNSEEGR